MSALRSSAQRRPGWRQGFTVAGVVLALLLQAACTGGAGTSAGSSTGRPGTPWTAPAVVAAAATDVAAGRETRLDPPGDGPSVVIPAGAVSGSGRLSVNPVDTGAAASGLERTWSIELTGAKLTGNATLTFPAAAGKPDPLVGFTDTTGFHPVKTIRAGNTVVVTTPHFSMWSWLPWDALMDQGRKLMDRIYSSIAQGKQPACPGQDQLAGRGVTVTSSSGARVMWCAGTRGVTTYLKVVNTRGYVMRLEYTPGLKLTHTPAGSAVVTGLASKVEQPSKRGNSVTLIGSGEEAEFDVTAPGPVGVEVGPSPAAMLATGALFAADTLGMILEHVGKNTKVLLDSLQAASCIEGVAKQSAYRPTNAADLNDYLKSSIDTSFSCFKDVMKDELGTIMAAVVSGLSWLASGLSTAVNGFGAAADSLFSQGNYQVTITTKTAPSSPAGVNWDPTTWSIGWGSLGPYNVGMEAKSAVAKGLVTYQPTPNCDFKWAHSKRIQKVFGSGILDEWRGGTSPDKLDLVATTDPRIATAIGDIHVGDPRSKVLGAFKDVGPYRSLLSSGPDDLVAYGPDGYAILFDFNESTAASAPVTMITATRGTRGGSVVALVGEC